MPISGLSNQWKTYDVLVDRFARLPADDAPMNIVQKYRMIRRLLAAIHDAIDETIYVGTSHSQMNFGTRDVESEHDRTFAFAYVDVVLGTNDIGEYIFRTKTRRIDGKRPTAEWIVHETKDEKAVVDTLLAALPNADTPVRRAKRSG